MKPKDYERLAIGRLVASARVTEYRTKRAAYEAAKVNSATWDNVESGRPVRDDRLAAVVAFLWPDTRGDWTQLPLDSAGVIVSDDKDLQQGFADVMRFADECRDRGVEGPYVNEFVGLGARLLSEAQRRSRLSVVDDSVDDLVAADEQDQSISGEQESPDTP